jgi:hypothetical protein
LQQFLFAKASDTSYADLEPIGNASVTAGRWPARAVTTAPWSDRAMIGGGARSVFHYGVAWVTNSYDGLPRPSIRTNSSHPTALEGRRTGLTEGNHK